VTEEYVSVTEQQEEVLVERASSGEQELSVAYDYDTVDRDLERLGMTVSRLPAEAGVVWRLRLPRGESVEEWEPGTEGLIPPETIARLIEGVVARKQLVPAPPLSDDPGARRLRDMIDEQRHALLVHEPGTRLGHDPENLHQHRVAARRTRAFLRASRAYVDPAWRRLLGEPLRELFEVTGPVRDLDVLLERMPREVRTLDDADRAGGELLMAELEVKRDEARKDLIERLDSEQHQLLLARLRFPPRLAAGVEAIPLERIARREFTRLAKNVARLGSKPDDLALHGLRIALKRARYAAELSSPDTKSARRFIDRAKALQTLLGEHQDAAQAEARLRATAVVDARTAAAFVAGRIAERQVARRAQLREQLPAAWRRLRESAAHLR
jgi:CHAD domain-containing protein